MGGLQLRKNDTELDDDKWIEKADRRGPTARERATSYVLHRLNYEPA